MNPTDFVPVAEESDLIVKLGSFVLSRAVREAARWHKELPRPDTPLFVSVNVSSRQLFQPELIKEVRHILGRAVIPKGSLRLEIAEALVMENPEKATAVLRQLADAGAGLALDDFGTGYSSLSYLNQFTFDTIKIDRSFLHASGENGSGSVILRSVVALSHELGKNVVIEGVETEDDVSLLRTIGCEYGQGYFYGEPMSEREVMALLKVARRSRTAHEQKKRASAQASEARRSAHPDPLATAPPSPSTPEPVRGGPAPRAAPATNGAGPPPVPAAPVATFAQAPGNSDRKIARPETTRPPAGPPPLPMMAPAETANDSVRLDTLPPSPLRAGSPPELRCGWALSMNAAPPVRTGPPPLRSGPTPPNPPAEAAPAARPPPLPPPPRGCRRPNPLRCRRPSPNALPSLPGAVHLASECSPRSCRSGVTGVAHEMRRVDADLRQRPLVLLLQIAIEQQAGVGRAV